MMRVESPTWPERVGDRPRILVENHDLGTGHAVGRVLESEGFEVAICGGPDAFRRHRCPLVATGKCALAAGADVIVHGLNPDRSEHAAVLQSLRTLHPDTPRVVEIPGPTRERHTELLEGSTVVPMPVTRAALVTAVHSRLRAKGTPSQSRSVDPLVGDGEVLDCEHCGDAHVVFTLDGEPRLQAVRCGSRTIPVGMENQRFLR